MSLVELSKKNNFTEIIKLIENGVDYCQLDDNGNIPFHYFNITPQSAPTLTTCDPILFKTFKTRRDIETDAVFKYLNGSTHVHSSIISRHCPSLQLNVSEIAAQIFVEWCYCKSSPTLEKTAPFCAVQKCMELLKCPEARQCWSYLEDVAIFISYFIPDITIEFLRYFENIDLVEDHPKMFKGVSQIFYSTFALNGGDDFIVGLSRQLVVRSLSSLITN